MIVNWQAKVVKIKSKLRIQPRRAASTRAYQQMHEMIVAELPTSQRRRFRFLPHNHQRRPGKRKFMA